MNVVWRFFQDEQQHWKWQQLSSDKSVVGESKAGYSDYEACLADARDHGHNFLPAQAARGKSRRLA